MPNTPADGDTIVVWFSCGAASAVAANRTIELYGDRCIVRVVNNPVAEEHVDNKRFGLDVQRWLGVPIETATHESYPEASAVAIWEKRKYMSGPLGAPCTMLLKKEARQQWEARNVAQWNVLGFTADERKRHERFVLTERDNVLPVLIEAGITKKDCFAILNAAGVRLPDIYGMGYPNANCIGCVKATSPTYWNHVRAMHPEVFAQRAEQSRRFGTRLTRVDGKRVFLDELSPTATGKPMKDMQVECGIFCEERVDNMATNGVGVAT